MSYNDKEILVPLLKVLADESRIRILGILADRDTSVDELSAYLGLKAPTVSHHLHRLGQFGLVSMQPQGTVHYYRFHPEVLGRLNRLLQPERLAMLAAEQGTHWEKKVLGDFLIGERLKEIPASRKKRLVILQWLVGKFDWDVKYRESEINQTIKNHHPDFATIRREFIMNRLMDRESGLYWRIPPNPESSPPSHGDGGR